MALSSEARQSLLDQCRQVLSTCPDLQKVGWYSEGWLGRTLDQAPASFDEAWNRWRELYRAAQRQAEEAAQALRNPLGGKRVVERYQRLAQEALNQKLLLLNQNLQREEADFYPYRYLATEGFLPGYNFPRLPLRAYIPLGPTGEFITRPRFLALAEFGPRNVVYHEGQKFRIVRALLRGDGEARLVEAKICRTCGYLHPDSNAQRDLCERCNSSLADGEGSDRLANLFRMTDMATIRNERIYCDEEERLRYGYQLTLHYRFAPGPGGFRTVDADITRHATPIAHITYAPTAFLWRINHGWRRARRPGFTLSMRDGYWTRRPDDIADADPEGEDEQLRLTDIRPYVWDIRNLLLLRWRQEPLPQEEALLTLLYALQKGLASHFQVEDDEIGVEMMGKEAWRSLAFWEAAEGGLGVFRLLVDEPEHLREVARKALEICHFDPNTGSDLRPAGSDLPCFRACYDCLLSYTNQSQHLSMNRHLVRDPLLALAASTVQQTAVPRSREAHYQWLKGQVDERSALEREFLETVLREGLRLPDHAQWRPVSDLPCTPDFFYEPKVCVFCDGPVHDNPSQQETDRRLRRLLQEQGYQTLEVTYREPVAEQVRRLAERYPTVFVRKHP